ncbi:MAG: TAT-variant-translocated molybdopterin oxidoreductase [Fimbriimonadaceae bacterium]|nr:TAT-variant-translocated molybdopterin oxidoreductase [Fimbriimonadaceae bacterium]
MDNQKPQQRLDLETIREQLSGKGGKRYWRSLEQVADTPEFQTWLEDEFPHRRTLLEIDRRSMLKVMGASIALAGLSGCRGYFLDQEKIVPYVKQPEELVPGRPLFYASAIPLSGYGVGVLVEQHEGRPTKIEGNPDHPESQGSSSAIMQASILSMYDPDRAQSVHVGGDVSTWEEFEKVVRSELANQNTKGGTGIRILTETVASPLVASAIESFKKKYPAATWHSWDPVGLDNARMGSKSAYGKVVNTVYDFSKAKVIVSLDSDFLVNGPGSLKYARDFADGRRLESTNGEMNRLYQFESFPTVTGTNADHRWAMKSSQVGQVAAYLASKLGIGASGPTPVDTKILDKILSDLQRNAGACVVIAGNHQPAEVHHLCHAINEKLACNGKTVLHGSRIDFGPENQLESLTQLTEALNASKVDLLLVLGGNPAYNAPADLKFGDALAKAKLKVHHSLHFDETSKLCDWHLPLTHFLEDWGDVKGYDGTVSLIQPLIAPLFESKSHSEVIHLALSAPKPAFDLLRNAYSTSLAGKAWDMALNSGTVPGTASTDVAISVSGSAPAVAAPISGVELIFREDAHVHDGRYANNGWLQELPKPLSKITWDNAIHLSPKMAQQLGVASEDQVVLEHNGAKIEGGAWVMPGHPEESITVLLGFGRKVGGSICTNAGVNLYPMRTSKTLAHAGGASLTKGSGTFALSTVQIHHTMEGRDIVRSGTLQEWKVNPTLKPEEAHEVEDVSMYPDKVFDYDGPQWGMTIDLNTCIGCNACVTACQAENNIPVVGKEQVKRGRELHWIRLDRYYVGGLDQPEETLHQPLMCVHCEKAPCEPVCPVGATMHSHEGLNQMVYNRCVGTRYCSNNCPYKVRRFNYLNYADNQDQFMDSHFDGPVVPVPLTGDKKVIFPGKITEEKVSGRSLLKMVQNPDVTVRGRGIMEKCTYCVQRINDSRIEAKKQGREIKDGEIVTACEQTCPTKAIVFGNVADKDSRVSKLRKDQRSYLLLEELNTRPRTSYLGRVRNPNPEIQA